MFKPAKAGPQKAITANLLGNGRVVFLDEAGGWVQALAEARLAADGPELDAALAIARAATEARVVVAPYASDGASGADAPGPGRRRARSRAGGPTVDYGADEARRLGAAG